MSTAAPLTLAAIRKRLLEAYPGIKAAELSEMLNAAAANPESEWLTAAVERVISDPQVRQLDGTAEFGFEDGHRVPITQAETDADEPEATEPDTADLLRVCLAAVLSEPCSRATTVANLGGVAALFSGIPQATVAVKLGLSKPKLSRAVESVRRIMQTAKPQRERRETETPSPRVDE